MCSGPVQGKGYVSKKRNIKNFSDVQQILICKTWKSLANFFHCTITKLLLTEITEKHDSVSPCAFLSVFITVDAEHLASKTMLPCRWRAQSFVVFAHLAPLRGASSRWDAAFHSFSSSDSEGTNLPRCSLQLTGSVQSKLSLINAGANIQAQKLLYILHLCKFAEPAGICFSVKPAHLIDFGIFCGGLRLRLWAGKENKFAFVKVKWGEMCIRSSVLLGCVCVCYHATRQGCCEPEWIWTRYSK